MSTDEIITVPLSDFGDLPEMLAELTKPDEMKLQSTSLSSTVRSSHRIHLADHFTGSSGSNFIQDTDFKQLQGYCLVFERMFDHYELEIVDVPNPTNDPTLANMQTIRMNTKKPKANGCCSTDHKLGKNKHINIDNILEGFIYTRMANVYPLKYRLFYSRDAKHQYIYVIVYVSIFSIENYMDNHDIPTEIDPRRAVLIGRKFTEFYLANRTYVSDVDKDPKYDGMDKLSLSLWDHIHIRFELTADQQLYNLVPQKNYQNEEANNNESVVNQIMYLRTLYDIIIDDRSAYGASFPLNHFLKAGDVPLVAFFALHEKGSIPVDRAESLYYQSSSKMNDDGCCSSICCLCCCCDIRVVCRHLKKICTYHSDEEIAEILDQIRGYYGEHVAFYFAFLQHYTKSVKIASILGVSWMIVQLVFSDIAVSGTKTIAL